MHIPPMLTAIVRTVINGCAVALQTASDVLLATRSECRRHHWTQLPALLSRLTQLSRHALAAAVDPRTFFPEDGDTNGRLHKDLDQAARRRRRAPAALRRRHAGMLLHALGDTADAVEATLTRHWQIYADEYAMPLLEDYLATRLRWRDPAAATQIDVFAWASNISGVWVATPAPVRRYLRRATQHERQLRAAYTRNPRRGVRTAPAVRPA